MLFVIWKIILLDFISLMILVRKYKIKTIIKLIINKLIKLFIFTW